MRTGIGISDTCTATSRPSLISTITGLDCIPRWAIVRRRSLSRRWHPLLHAVPQPCSFFIESVALDLRDQRE